MNRTLLLVFTAALCAAPAAVMAQAAPQAAHPKTYDFRDDADPWLNDPAIHDFYQATVEAFARGADHLDRAAYETRCHEIFRSLAVAHGMSPEAVENHMKPFPGQMIQIVTRDPRTLASYGNFTLALFGPQPQHRAAEQPAPASSH